VKLLMLLIAAGILIGDALVVERNSPGLVPSMKTDYVNAYGPDLAFLQTVATFPLLRAPGAITFSPSGDVLLGEFCDPSPCTQIERYDSSGNAKPFGAPIHDTVQSMQFVASGDLIVLQSGVLTRLDGDGRGIGSTPLPVATLVLGFDIDRDQCTVVFAGLDKLGITNICSDGAATELLPVFGDFFDVRFLPNGNILGASRVVVREIDRHGRTLRGFITSEQDYGEVALDPDGTSFRTTANNRLFRFDLVTGNSIGQPAQLRNCACGARSMAIRGEWRAAMHPAPHRRSVLH
jgi:hypothetical protein